MKKKSNNWSTPCIGVWSEIHKAVVKFGNMRNVPQLSEVVMDLYDAALQPSSRNTYRTGQRAYDRFIRSMRGGLYLPFQRRLLGETELNLAFFIAFLVLEPRITKASTILGYTSHKICIQGRRLRRKRMENALFKTDTQWAP